RLQAPRTGGITISGQALVNVNVNVDETRRHVQPGRIDGFQRARGRDVGCKGGNLSVLDPDIAYGAEIILAIDYVAPLDQKVEIGLSTGDSYEKTDQQKFSQCHLPSPVDSVRL